MSLTSQRRLFAGHEQASVASLLANGVFYRCYTWLNLAEQRVEAACYAVVSGEEVLVFSNVIAAASPEETSATNGVPLDCPKIIATGTTFVVHWLQATGTILVGGDSFRDWAMYRATMDMAAFSAVSWTQRGASNIYEIDVLYDVAPVLGHAQDFVLARKTDTDEITVQRFSGYDWVDIAWIQPVTREIQPRVLSVYAHDADNDVVLSYQPTNDDGSTLWSAHLDADDGGDFIEVRTFAAFPIAFYVQAKHCRVGPNRVAVVAEAQTLTNQEGETLVAPGHGWIHHVLFREISSADATRIGNEHWRAHLYLCSAPWAYADGSTGVGSDPNVYCVVSHKSIYETNDWEQAYTFAVNLDYAMWSLVDDGAGLGPRAISTAYTVGIPDARGSGWHPENGDIHGGGPAKRVNHVSEVSGAPPTGPDVKTRTVAVGVFARIQTSLTFNETGSELLPENAGVSWLRVYMEDPWTIYRDASDSTQPETNFKFPFPRSACQSVEVGRGLFFGGGTPAIYDGRQVVECGFLWRPEIFAADPFASGSSNWDGQLTGGAYQWYAVYSWRDNAGQMHRSGPSRIFNYSLINNDDGIVLRVRTQTLSLKDARARYPLSQAIQIELFRTEAGGSTFYRVYGASRVYGAGPGYRPTETPANDPTRDYVDVFDGVSDANLVRQGLGPYQYGEDAAAGLEGPLPQTVPALTAIANWGNRVWGADALDPSVLWYSDEVLPDYGGDYYLAPVWTDAQTFRIGDIGEVVAMRPMNNSLIVFTASTIFALNSSDAGGGLLNVSLEVLHEGTGCIDPRSVVLAPPGLMFLSAKGYYLLGRGRELDYVSAGAAVEDDIREAGNIRSATLLEDRHQIRLVCNGLPLVTQTAEFDLAGFGSIGTWSIEFVEAGVTVSATQSFSETTSDIAADLEAAIDALVPTTLAGVVASASSVGSLLTVVFASGVHDQTFVLVDPPGATLSVESSETLRTTPRVLIYDYFFRQWSRAQLVQTSPNTRLAEAVDGCAWRGLDGAVAHVVLTQGALLVERGANDPLAYTDQTSTGNVGIPIDLQSSWFHAAGIAGYQRIRSIGIQAAKLNNSEYSVDLDYCRDGDYANPETETGLAVQTISPAYSRVRPSVQKTSAVRVRIYESLGVQNLENIRVTALVFDVGLKKGPRRVSPTQIAS